MWSDSYGSINYDLGNIGGERLHQLTIAEMPSHNHKIYGDDQLATFMTIAEPGIILDWSSGHESYRSNWYYTTSSGGDQAHNIMQPYMSVYYIIKT